MKNSTLKKLLPLLLLPLLSFTVKAQTNVSGFISANATWDLAGSPYIVVSNALVSQGVTLTINPGVVVKLDSACALQVDGEMIAIGTDTSRITFTSNKADPKPGDWAELHFSNFAVSATFDNSGNYLSGCIMKYCDVLYGGALQYGEIHIESSSPYFSRCNISNSASSGVYCNGSSYLIDSSAVANCYGYGLYFSNVTLNSCGVTILSDTITNCAGGVGMYQSPGCKTIINNNYFISNGSGETLIATTNIGEITGNYFINNYTSYADGGLVQISGNSLLITGNSFINNVDTNKDESFNSIIFSITGNSIITDNSFINNITVGNGDEFDAIVFISNGNSIISNNSFINDSINSFSIEAEGIIFIQTGIDTIQCNLFMNNELLNNSEGGTGCINVLSSNSVIRNNIFDGNVNNDSTRFGASVAWISGNSLSIPTSFTNNTIRNNSAPLNACCVFKPILNTNNQLLHIEQNNFINNVAKEIIYLTGANTSNATYNFVYMKYNNFNDPAAQYELYNDIPYGSPDLYPDSNYWGSTSTQHIDSVIYDYFDNENQSVVYYEPILTAPVAIDTTCSGSIPTAIKIITQPISTTAFPNPFSNSTEVKFGKDLQDAEVDIYNVFGQKVRAIEHFSGNEISIDRGNLSSGVYIYEIVEKQAMVANGKLVIE